jgi:hypothetical protein
MKLIFIHGRSQGGKDAEELRLFWEGSLDRAFHKARLKWPANTEVVLPFYADDLDRMVEEVKSPLVTNVMLRGTPPPVSSQEALRVEILREMIDAQGGNAIEKIEAQFAGQPRERGFQNWPWVLAMLRVLDSTPIGGDLIDKITRDVWVYVTFGGVRRKIDQIVAAAIPAEPCVVVAHSLGTIVAYNILSDRTPDSQPIPMLMTLGSPLGIRAISARLRRPLAMPTGVKAWFNAHDPRDTVALHKLDRDHFDITPAIEDYADVDNFTDNRHSIDGYLADPEVARRIHAALSI